MVAEHVNDPKALFNLSLVNHAWHNAAKLVLRKVHVSIDWTDPTRDSLSQMLAGPTQGSMIRSLMIIFPNHPCLNVRYFLDTLPLVLIFLLEVNGGRGKHSTGYGRARYHSFKKYVLETVPRIPELRYLTVHFRPPRESLGPFRYTQKDKLLAHTFLIDAISKILLERSDIRELSIQGLPIYARFPNSNRSYSHPEHDTNVILAKQRLQAFKIGLVANDVWAPSPRVGSDEDPNASPQALTSSQEPELPIPVEKIIKGPPISPWSSRNTLRHISLTSWGFYQKLRTPSRGVDRNIHTSFFPALESLELRGFGINNDSSMHGWIFASKLTLRSLKLIDCAIIHQMVDCHDADLELGRNNEVTPPNQQFEHADLRNPLE
ncbi:hypothetical protein N7468_007925 [Penicillium chermesinum]|uniref:Uncharacterized protein n=1 Tax=Penicillium chermesinum TaxID=63820 RepID=A0A9W9THZ0_9EURO|nr:uncharacterized protein N7468_007925 [Penicillium chermesinum]KAJ5223383.1 hypothetical protein N7468_007925 [Penicillium chermesinum]